MTFGDLFMEYYQTILSILCVYIVLQFYYNGHNLARRVLLFVRNFVKNTADAFYKWIEVFDVFNGEDVNDGCKDM